MRTLPGSTLRDNISRMLQLKHNVVIPEKRLISTTADIYFIDETSHLFPQTIAVESKDWARPLSSSDLAKIFNLYEPSLKDGEIDYLWIIGQHVLASSPRDTLTKMKSVRYSTIDEFNTSLMNFNALISHNRLSFDHHESASNFIHARTLDGRSMDEVTDDWLSSAYKGMMVYGGYGIGKTTYSLYLAKRLSDEYAARKITRIPIRVALGGFYTKQDLVSLICSTLNGDDSACRVPNFSYHLFLEMCKNGSFVLILDGFDEMRHAMDFEDFIYVFEQMKPLFNGESKVLILGRPDSFLTENEESRALSALTNFGDSPKRNIMQVELAFFSNSDISKYIGNHISKAENYLTKNQIDKFSKNLKDLPDGEDSILSRPVQLWMFTIIMAELIDLERDIKRYDIYSRFIYRFLAREESKKARTGSPETTDLALLREDRKKFMRQIAWWILTVKKENKFTAVEIPTEFIPSSIKLKKTFDSALREAIVGSIIEPISKSTVIGSKGRRYYYFPHKSYIEFLVAEYFIATKFSKDVFRTFMAIINREIMSFIKEYAEIEPDMEISAEGQESKVSILSKLREGLSLMMGNVDYELVSICAGDSAIAAELKNMPLASAPYQIFTQFVYVQNNGMDVDSFLIKAFGRARGIESASACLICSASYMRAAGNIETAINLFVFAFTSVFIQRRQIFSGEILRFYNEDTTSFLGSVLLCFHCESKDHIKLSFVDLLMCAESATKNSLFCSFPSGSQNGSYFTISVTDIRHALQVAERTETDKATRKGKAYSNPEIDDRRDKWTEYFDYMIHNIAVTGRLPIRLFGAAAARFRSADG